MKRLSEQFEHIKTALMSHPKTIASLAAIGLFLFLLRKYHYKFIVYPGTEESMQRSEVGTTTKTWPAIGIRARAGWRVKTLRSRPTAA